MNANRSAGIAALADLAGIGERELDTAALSFQIIPRLNAPGRLADAGISLELLTTTDRRRAQNLRRDDRPSQQRAQKADRRRRGVGGTADTQALERLAARRHHGRPSELGTRHRRAYRRSAVREVRTPPIAVAIDGAQSRGSARSVPSCNILEVIDESAHLMTRYGGHAQAAGFRHPHRQPALARGRFEELPADRYGAGEPEFEIDMIADPSYVQREAFEFAESLAPSASPTRAAIRVIPAERARRLHRRQRTPPTSSCVFTTAKPRGKR